MYCAGFRDILSGPVRLPFIPGQVLAGRERNTAARRYWSLLFFLFLFCTAAVAAAPDNSPYSVIYTISPHPDGSANWTLEYRAILPDSTARNAFREEMEHPRIVTPEAVCSLMQRSAAEASAVTGRQMEISGFHTVSDIQTTPTGTYGVIVYSFTWSGFSRPGDRIEIGDVFPLGLYLPRETSLIVRPPKGYSVEEADPAPDQRSGELVWSGQRAFAAGSPRIVLAAPSLPWTNIILPSVVLVGGTVFLGWWGLRRRCSPVEPECFDDLFPEEIPVIVPPSQDTVAADDLQSTEDRILRMLAENGGELYQTEIARRLDAPKSTVSTALNVLHAKGAIQKIRKGRENLIRRV